MKPFSPAKLPFLTFLFLLAPSLFAIDYINNPAYIASNGFGETEQIAQQNALAGISKFFQMSISVDAAERTTVNDEGSKSTISEDVFVKSETELFAVHYTKAKYNKKQKLYSLTAFIDRNEAWKIYRPRLDSDVQSFEHYFSDAHNQNETILKIMSLSKATGSAAKSELEKKLDFAVALYPDSYDLYAETRNHISDAEPLKKSLCRKCSMTVECENDFEEIVQTRIEEAFSKIGMGENENAESKYECVVSVSENEKALPAGTFYTPAFTVEISKDGSVLFSSGGQVKRTGAKNEDVAKQRAYSAVANSAAEILSKEFLSN